MIRHNLNISLLFLLFSSLLSSTGCTEALDTPTPPVESDGEVVVGIRIPTMSATATRALPQTPSRDLKLSVFEFEEGSNASDRFLVKVYQAETLSATDVADNGTVQFRIPGLLMTRSRRVLHFVVAPEYLTASYASEAQIFSTLAVGDFKEAYWGRVAFPNGYTEDEITPDSKPQLSEDARQRLADVPVIRNFAMVSVEKDNSLSNFNIIGFELVNVPSSGTVAPYNAPALACPDLTVGEGDAVKMKSYLDITGSDADQEGYGGIMPPGAGLYNREENFNPQSQGGRPLWSNQPFCLYEHPFESTQRTFLILRAEYRRSASAAWQECYYKLDLVHNNAETGLPKYYHIIRNFNYRVNIRSVAAPGADSYTGAIAGPTYNNISADVDARDMAQISDGANVIEVGSTSIVFTTQTPVKFMYRYYPVGGKSSAATNALLKKSGLAAGAVIGSVEESGQYTDATGAVWNVLTITPKPIPEGLPTEQSFFLADGKGLGREVRLVAHVPYDFSGIAVYPGAHNTLEEAAAVEGAAARNTVSPLSGEPFTVYFNLPAGMPEAMFPLVFTLESNRQNMENNKIGTLVVTSGESGFPSADAYQTPRIKYEKSVSYAEYLYKTDTSNNLIVDAQGRYVPNDTHAVRCRFLTINALADLPGAVTKTETRVLITNPYFNSKGASSDVAAWPGIATFTRTIE